MLFNFGKCKCLHTGHGNLNVNYKMGDTVLGTTVKEFTVTLVNNNDIVIKVFLCGDIAIHCYVVNNNDIVIKVFLCGDIAIHCYTCQ